MKKHHLALFLSVIIVASSCVPAPTPVSTAAPQVPPTTAPQPQSTIAAATSAPTPTVDAVETDVARAKTVAARLTADASLQRPSDTPTRPPTSTPTATPLPTFTPRPTPQAYVQLVNRHSQMCLTAPGGSGPVVQDICDRSRNDQLWLVREGEKQVALESKSGVCVGYDPSNTTNALHQVGCSGPRPWTVLGYASYYTIGTVSIRLPHAHPTTAPIALGMYYQFRYENDCVDAEGWNHNPGQRIIHTTCRYCYDGYDNDNQLWARN